MGTSLDIQVGGNHYKNFPYQPLQLSVDMRLNFIQGNIVKYITRYKYKNGKQDLLKVVHYASLGKELKPLNFALLRNALEAINLYASMNNLNDTIKNVIHHSIYQNWTEIISLVEALIKEEYGAVS